MEAAAEVAETGTIRRHDVAGRIFHRLLDTRKFLATNYTTVPAAMTACRLGFRRAERVLVRPRVRRSHSG